MLTNGEAENIDTSWLDLLGEAKLKELSKEEVSKETLARELNKEKDAFYEKIKNLLSDSNKNQPTAKSGAHSTGNEVKPQDKQSISDQEHETLETEKLIVTSNI